MKLIKELSDGVLDGDFVGSTEISFVPGDMKGGEFSVDTKTAGYSINLWWKWLNLNLWYMLLQTGASVLWSKQFYHASSFRKRQPRLSWRVEPMLISLPLLTISSKYLDPQPSILGFNLTVNSLEGNLLLQIQQFSVMNFCIQRLLSERWWWSLLVSITTKNFDFCCFG